MNDDSIVDDYQRAAYSYFARHADAHTGLVADTSASDSDASIAGSGMALTSHVVACHRGWVDRDAAALNVLHAIRFLSAIESTRGFFFHFLDRRTGERAGRCEVSTMDSALLFAGCLAAAEFFDRDCPVERELREKALGLYLRADWQWASPRSPAISHGWTPERGFLRYDWRGYNEALLIYILALGSPTHAVPASSYDTWLESYSWKSIYGHSHVYGGPLFIHQMTHAWIDMRGIQDSYMRMRGIDYFENSRRATLVQREYARRNPRRFEGYSENCWGFSSSACPVRGYRARGAPFGHDDGTIAPWTTAASLPFAPEIVLPALGHIAETVPRLDHGSAPSFNRTYSPGGWTASHTYAIDEGPVVLMLENHRSDLIWSLMRRSPYVRRGLERAGFTGGWLEAE
jgi:hypothetical protein